jgi:uncharacterized protein HemY
LLNDRKELRMLIEKHLRDAVSLGLNASRELAIHLANRVVVDNADYLATEAEKLLRVLAKNRDPLVKEVLGALFLHLDRFSDAKTFLEQAKIEGSEHAGDLLVQYGLS